MRTIDETFLAGETKTFNMPGGYFRILSVPFAIDVNFLKGNMSLGEPAKGVGAGYWAKFPDGGEYDSITIYSATAQAIRFAVSLGYGGYDMPPSSAVALIQGSSISDNAPVSVGVGATALVGYSQFRKSLRFFNAGSVDVYIGGSGVTTANGALKLQPSATWVETEGAAAAWYGISGTAGQSVRVQEVS